MEVDFTKYVEMILTYIIVVITCDIMGPRIWIAI
jgi:hypothetical protein